MTNHQKDTLITSLETLLEREKQALINGNLNEIADLLSEKEAIVLHLTKLEVSLTEHLVPLRQQVLRNQALLDGALKGIREVADRMRALRAAHNSLETYNSVGKRSVVDTTPKRQLEKRA